VHGWGGRICSFAQGLRYPPLNVTSSNEISAAVSPGSILFTRRLPLQYSRREDYALLYLCFSLCATKLSYSLPCFLRPRLLTPCRAQTRTARPNHRQNPCLGATKCTKLAPRTKKLVDYLVGAGSKCSDLKTMIKSLAMGCHTSHPRCHQARHNMNFALRSY